MLTASTPPLRVAWFIWGLGALLYLMGFFQRVAPAVMTDELMRAFSINAAGLGSLSALYFYSYVAMQIPTGILADRWGPRRLLAAGALVAALGTGLFALAESLFWAGTGRLLIGGSVAVAFVGLLKVATNWFPVRLFALVSGLALFSGVVGAVFAGPPLRFMMGWYSWRVIIAGSAIVTLGMGIGIWIFVRDTPSEKGYAEFVQLGATNQQVNQPGIMGGLVEIFRYTNTWLICFIPGAVVGAVLTFSGLWGVPYLATHHNLSTAGASALATTLMVAWAVGGPVFGWFSDRVGRRKAPYFWGCAVSLAAWGGALLLPDLPMPALVSLLAIAGFCSGCMIIGFAFAKESVPVNLAGTVSGLVNMCTMAGPMILQPAVGWILDQKWQGQMENGIRVYPLEAYQAGFGLMLAWLVLACILLIFTRETNCCQMVYADEQACPS